MPTAEAHVRTGQPGRYLAQLCKHARQVHRMRHRPPAHNGSDGQPPPRVQHVAWTDTDGVVSFGWGQCTLQATPNCSRSARKPPARKTCAASKKSSHQTSRGLASANTCRSPGNGPTHPRPSPAKPASNRRAVCLMRRADPSRPASRTGNPSVR